MAYDEALKLPGSASAEWLSTLAAVFYRGHRVAPRGKPTRELTHHTVRVDLRYPVVGVAERKLSYTFAAAEALWILSGDNTVAGIAPYNPNIAQFSDDGIIFNGAYGPPIAEQLPFVVAKLIEDRETRQAVLTIWNRSPAPSKDVPCTVALAFGIRDNRLSCHAFMRSSDVWLGLPYDVFNFATVAVRVACEYNLRAPDFPVALGALYLTAVSSHLYDSNQEAVRGVLTRGVIERGRPIPREAVAAGDWGQIEAALIACRDKFDPAPNLWRIRP